MRGAIRISPPSPVALWPCLFLIGVAAHQILRTQTDDLTAWKGGGYGMFSTIDSGSGRTLRITLHDERGSWIPRGVALKNIRRRVRALPSERELRRLGTTLARMHWTPLRDEAEWPPRNRPEARRWARPYMPERERRDWCVRPDSVEVACLRQSFDVSSATLRLEVLGSRRVTTAEHRPTLEPSSRMPRVQ